jgi:hypothetical protein
MWWLVLSSLLWSAVALGHLWALAPATLFAAWGVHGLFQADDAGEDNDQDVDLGS